MVILPTLRRMSHLEELTLYLHISNGPTFVTGPDLDEQILIHLPRLHAFSFHIACRNDIAGMTCRMTHEQIEQTFANGKYGQVVVTVDYFEPYKMICRIFSLPCKFSCLENLGNNIPNIRFDTVTSVSLSHLGSFKHELFVRLARAFPFLENLSITNIKPPFLNWHCEDRDWCSIIEYSHLIFLNMDYVNPYYLEHFLNEKNMSLPRLTKLKVDYRTLQKVTHNFTRVETKRNCAKVKCLVLKEIIVQSESFYRYFPSLLFCSHS